MKAMITPFDFYLILLKQKNCIHALIHLKWHTHRQPNKGDLLKKQLLKIFSTINNGKMFLL